MRIEMKLLLSSVWTVLWVLLLAAAAENATAAESPAETGNPETEARLEKLEENVDILTEEMGRLESIFAVPEEIALESFNGLGPAASKVYKRDRGLSIGGYGEVRLR